MGKEKEAEIGDFVFAKVRGYPAWPARIVAISDPRPASLKYTVFFYGTSETATVQAKEVYPYASNKERFGKPMKRKFFNEGIEELEEQLKKLANGEKITKGAIKADETAGTEGRNVRKPRNTSEEKEDSMVETSSDSKSAKSAPESDESETVAAIKRKRKANSVAETSKDKGETGSAEVNVAKDDEEDSATTKRKRKGSSVAENLKDKMDASSADAKVGKRKRESDSVEKVAAKRKRKGSSVTEAAKVGESGGAEAKEKRGASVDGDASEGRKRRKSSVTFADPAESSGKEQISRSGRVIKPKKFLYDEESKDEGEPKGKSKDKLTPASDGKDEPEPKGKHKERTVGGAAATLGSTEVNEESTPKKKRKKKGSAAKEEFSPETKGNAEETGTPPKLSAMGRVIWARTKGGQLVQVKVDHDRPSSFKDDKARVTWEKAYEAQLKKVKKRIESGKALPEDVPVQLPPSPDRLSTMTAEEINSCKKLRLIERKRGKVRWLKLETRLVDIDVLLKTCLQKTKVDIDKALQLMDELINLPLDPLMLKKHPQLVETTRKIRQYTGNVQSWNMSAEEELKFQKSATKIRQKANILLNKFRGLFAVPKADDFWSVFLSSVNEFKALTKHLPPARVYSLIVDPSSPYYKEVAEFDNEEEEFGKEIMKANQVDKDVAEKESDG